MGIISIPKTSHCPICGLLPSVEQCWPWDPRHGSAPWVAGCYSHHPEEHYIGVNGDNQLDAIRLWNSEVEKIVDRDFESAAHQP